jgi:hypothetical protein
VTNAVWMFSVPVSGSLVKPSGHPLNRPSFSVPSLLDVAALASEPIWLYRHPTAAGSVQKVTASILALASWHSQTVNTLLPSRTRSSLLSWSRLLLPSSFGSQKSRKTSALLKRHIIGRCLLQIKDKKMTLVTAPRFYGHLVQKLASDRRFNAKRAPPPRSHGVMIHSQLPI